MRSRAAMILVGAAISGVALLLGLAVFAPGMLCKLQPLGDEGEGECLGFVAEHVSPARCAVVAALLVEIEGANNDVVIAEGLRGFVSAKACDDLAAVWTGLPNPPPAHVPQLIASAIDSCRNRESYSLGKARSAKISSDAIDATVKAAHSRCM